jgi:hypothetical protein
MSKTFVILLMVLSAHLLAAGGAEAGTLRPHRAIYDLTAEDIRRQSGILSVEGRLAYEITGSACEGWSTTYRLANRYAKSEGQMQLTDTQLTSWEAADGSEMQINEKQYVDQSLQTETNLSAQRRDGNQATVRMTRPDNKTFDLPADAVFPLMHQRLLLDRAAVGEVRDSRTVYDGSDGEQSYRAVSLIAPFKAQPSQNAVAESQAAMRGMPAWSVSMAYYAIPDDKAELPAYQSTFVMYENGVTSRLLFTYDDYALRGKLVSLELLPEEKCP